MFCYMVSDSPPLNVTLSSPTSTSIHVNWDLPDPLSRNGIITKHQLNYTEASLSLNWNTVELHASTSYLIEELKILLIIMYQLVLVLKLLALVHFLNLPFTEH